MIDQDPRLPQLEQQFACSGKVLKVISLIAHGPFSHVYKLVNTSNKRQFFALKTEKRETHQRRVLVLDAKILLKLNNLPGFPRLLDRGRTSYYNYIVMDYLGPSLAKLRRAAPNKKFSNSTGLQIAKQTLERIKTLHEADYINRDIKASNFAVGYGDNKSNIFMFDFGLSRCFVDQNGNILPPRKSTALLGTIMYAPIAAHNFQEQCRRDDLESWFYMCIEMFKGYLPWEGLDPTTQHQAICDWKNFIRNNGREDFLKDCPLEFDEIFDVIIECGFFATPKYWKIDALIEAAFDRLKIDRHAPFDWEVNKKILYRAEVIGEIGETNLITQQLRALNIEARKTAIWETDDGASSPETQPSASLHSVKSPSY